MGLRTGDEYLAGLDDGREIWIDGRRVSDVRSEPGMRNTALTVAQYYDMQNNPDLEDLLTYETDDGDRAHLSFIEPRSIEDLRRRGAAFAAWAEVTAGQMGRAPDYMNACMMAVGAAQHAWGRHDPEMGRRAYDIYLHCRRNDVCMTHTFVNPMVDRFTPIHEQEPHINASVVERTADGVIVSGARMVGTLAPFSDENVSFAGPGMLTEDGKANAISFQSKVATPGLRWICRDIMDPEAPHYDRPLSTRFDEMDALAVYEDCFIPWDDVFLCEDIEIHNGVLRDMRFQESLGHHVIVKNVAKTRFLLGLAHLLAESTQISGFVNVQERLGDILMYLQIMESLAIAAVEGAQQNPENGLYYCNSNAINAALRLFPEAYPRMIDHLKQLGGGGYVSLPQEATLEVADLAIDKYVRGAEVDAKEKISLFRLAWDVAGSGWGGRTELYERFFFGDNTQFKARTYLFYDKTEAAQLVSNILQAPDGRERLRWPDRFRPN